MRILTTGHTTSFVAFAALCVGIAIHAQEVGITNREGNPTEIKSLEDVRRLSTLEPFSVPAVSTVEGEATGPETNSDAVEAARKSEDPRRAAMQQIRQLQERLTLPDSDRSQISGQLKAALADYFVADMVHRVRELDDIRAKLVETEAKLQKRLDEQQEAVDFQLKTMLREADGLGFFNPEDAPENGAPNVTIRPVPGRPGAYLRVEKNPLGIETITVVDPNAKTSRGPIPRPKAPSQILQDK